MKNCLQELCTEYQHGLLAGVDITLMKLIICCHYET